MSTDADEGFYERADAHIELSNQQLAEATRGRVSASMMFALARFNAWITACGFESPEAMQAARDETLDYFADQYRQMLGNNLDDYIANFEQYMQGKS